MQTARAELKEACNVARAQLVGLRLREAKAAEGPGLPRHNLSRAFALLPQDALQQQEQVLREADGRADSAEMDS